MAIKTILTITHDKDTAADMTARLSAETNNPKLYVNRLQDYLQGVSSGIYHAKIDSQVDQGSATAASGTLTLASVVATNTCAVNGVTFTCVASGATGNQFNVGGTDTVTATNLAAAINASVTALVSGYVTATSAGAVVTVTAAKRNQDGNMCTISGGQATITASGARLTGGTDASANTYSYGL